MQGIAPQWAIPPGQALRGPAGAKLAMVAASSTNCPSPWGMSSAAELTSICPSCYSKHLVDVSRWLAEDHLAPVPQRHMDLTVRKRLRPYVQRRKLLDCALCSVSLERLK